MVICDVTESAEKINAALSPHQPFDYLINNAGAVKCEDFLDVTEDSINKFAFAICDQFRQLHLQILT